MHVSPLNAKAASLPTHRQPTSLHGETVASDHPHMVKFYILPCRRAEQMIPVTETMDINHTQELRLHLIPGTKKEAKISPSVFIFLVNLQLKLFISLNKAVPLSVASLLSPAVNMAAIISGAEKPMK